MFNELTDLVNSALYDFPQTGQNYIEILELAKIIYFLKPHNFLEVGTQYGGTFCVLSSLSTGKKISIDLENGCHGGVDLEVISKRNSTLQSRFNNTHFLNLDSHEQSTLDKVQKILNGEDLDLLFIDGDHSYEGVKKDYEMYRPLVRPGGMVIFHDINYEPRIPECEVYKFWNELFKSKETGILLKYELNAKTSWVFVKDKDNILVKSDLILGGFGVMYI